MDIVIKHSSSAHRRITTFHLPLLTLGRVSRISVIIYFGVQLDAASGSCNQPECVLQKCVL